MKIVFVTNFYNHHQKPLADAFYSLIGDGYSFIETEPISEERLKMGWGGDEKPDYVLQNYKDEFSRNKCQDIIDSADVVILGSAPWRMIKTRLKKGRLTFIYSERLYKKRLPIFKLPFHFLRFWARYNRFKNVYLLCASAYAAADYMKTFSFLGKMYKWGYFPEFKEHNDLETLIKLKTKSSILWVGRFIELKHPEYAIAVAKHLKEKGYDFTLNMIGNGALEDHIAQMIQDENLEGYVNMMGAMKPEQVRENMEKSEIFLFTSDRNEGWGAVLNESMNSACAVVADKAIGSVPFLLSDGENGLLYHGGDINALCGSVEMLLENTLKREHIAKNAYTTIKNEWNAQTAARKMIFICEKTLSEKGKPLYYDSGICSIADKM